MHMVSSGIDVLDDGKSGSVFSTGGGQNTMFSPDFDWAAAAPLPPDSATPLLVAYSFLHGLRFSLVPQTYR